jgi:AAA domain
VTSFMFRPAVRQNVSLLIGLAGASGSGKTYTAMRLAKGIAGDKPFAVIDTEAGRAKHYADAFRFDHGDLKAPFSPHAYAEAIAAADTAGYSVIVVDSCSHEHAGTGGILDMQEAEFARMGGKDAVKMASWIKPKGEHRKMVQKLLQVRAHLILCFRAEEKIEMARNAEGKMEVRKKVTATGIDGWQPICEKNLPYELTASFLLMASRPGVPLPIKLQSQHRALFPLDKEITEESGRLIAAWATGGKESSPPPVQRLPTDGVSLPSPNGAGGGAGPESAAAQDHSEASEAGPKGNAGNPAPRAGPTDAELVADIEKRVKRKDFDSAFDLARGIQDQDLNEKTIARINKALAFVTEKAAAKAAAK